MKKMTYGCAALAGLALMGAQAACADVTAKYQTTDARRGTNIQTIQYADDAHVRMDIADQGRVISTMIKVDDKVYAISDGKVIDLSGGMGAAMAGMFGGGSSDSGDARFEDTGRSETVAGIRGKVYRFTKSGETHEVVLSEDRYVAQALQGLTAIVKAVGARSASDRAMEDMRRDSGMRHTGLLRFDHSLRLISISHGRVPDSAFALTGEAVAASGYSPTQAEKSSRSESVVEKDAKDIGNHTVEEAHQSTKQGIQKGISDQVEEGIGSMMHGIFGR